MTELHRLIAALNPDVYCESTVRKQVKQAIQEGRRKDDPMVFQKAAKTVQVRDAGAIDVSLLEEKHPSELPGQQSPIERHTLTYDSFGDSLEGIYFWLYDEMSHRLGW